MESNKEEALRCLHMAEIAYGKQGNVEKARRLAVKSLRLFPSEKGKAFLSMLDSQFCNSQHGDGCGKNGSSFAKKEASNREYAASGRSEKLGGATDHTDFTSEQVESIKRIRQCHDYYEVLGVQKTTTDSDLKRAYRKLALQFHPDKCRAPGAAEAFKAIGNAFATLSDAEKRKQYDLHGPELSQQQCNGRGRSGCYENDPGHGFESDMTAEEIFNMFFGGGFPGQAVYARRSDAAGRFRQGHRFQRTYTNEGREANNYAALIQLMPILIIVFMSLFSSFLVSDPLYNLQLSAKYNVRRTTNNLRIPYYVKDSFASEFTGSLRRLENTIEEDYVSHLRQGCFREKSYKESMLWQARYSGNANLLSQAHHYATPSCDKMEKIYSNN